MIHRQFYIIFARNTAPTILLPGYSYDLSIYEDSSNTLTIDDVFSQKVQLRLNISDSGYWLKFIITNPHENKKSLILSISCADNIKFHVSKTGEIYTRRSGSVH